MSDGTGVGRIELVPTCHKQRDQLHSDNISNDKALLWKMDTEGSPEPSSLLFHLESA